MSLDGLRAWIGLVERKLTMRTRVFLVLVAIAIGGAAAGIYLAVDAGDEAVSKADLEAVRTEVGASEASTVQPTVESLEARLSGLEGEIADLRAAKSGGDSGAAKKPSEAEQPSQPTEKEAKPGAKSE